MLAQVVLAPGSQYGMENGRSACSCICLEAAISILGQLRSGEWSGTTDDVQVPIIDLYAFLANKCLSKPSRCRLNSTAENSRAICMRTDVDTAAAQVEQLHRFGRSKIATTMIVS